MDPFLSQLLDKSLKKDYFVELWILVGLVSGLVMDDCS
jgi:hypothetical protein